MVSLSRKVSHLREVSKPGTVEGQGLAAVSPACVSFQHVHPSNILGQTANKIYRVPWVHILQWWYIVPTTFTEKYYYNLRTHATQSQNERMKYYANDSDVGGKETVFSKCN